jgi:CBS domain-containing protein
MNTVSKILDEKPDAKVFSVVPQQSILSAAQYMKANNIGAVAVIRDGELLGMLSERDILNKVTGPGIDPRDITVNHIMSHDVATTTPNETWDDCLIKMGTTHCRHLPVLENGKLIGMISLRDIVTIDQVKCLDSYLWDAAGRF